MKGFLDSSERASGRKNDLALFSLFLFPTHSSNFSWSFSSSWFLKQRDALCICGIRASSIKSANSCLTIIFRNSGCTWNRRTLRVCLHNIFFSLQPRMHTLPSPGITSYWNLTRTWRSIRFLCKKSVLPGLWVIDNIQGVIHLASEANGMKNSTDNCVLRFKRKKKFPTGLAAVERDNRG